MKRIETILSPSDYIAFEKACNKEGRSMRKQIQVLIIEFIKTKKGGIAKTYHVPLKSISTFKNKK